MKVETGIIIASLLLALFLVWKEIKRPAKAHLFLRLTASILGVAALACMILPVNYTVTSPKKDPGAIVILTPGYDKDSLDAYKGLPQYTTQAALASAGPVFIPDLAWFLTQHRLVNELHVFGYGLTDDELAFLSARAIHVQYHTPTQPPGFTAAGWPRQLHQGDWLEVQGSFHNPGKDSVKIILTGLGSRFDSATIKAATTQTFRLQYKPAHLGPTIYELTAINAGKTISKEKIPVHVLPTNRLQVLLLSSSPDFDNKFLTTWLYENQYKVATRNTISKNKYSQQFLNREALPLQTISTTLLEKFDVVIADDQELAALPAKEKAALRSQVQQGLGLILQTDSAMVFKNFSVDLQVKKQPGSPVSARSLAMPAVFTTTTPLLPTQWYSIENNRLGQPLVMDDKGAAVVSAAISGAGKLIVNTVNNTYSWVLSGNKQDYAQFWSLLLNKAARRNPQQNRWQQITAFPTVGNPVQLTLETTSPNIPVIETPSGRAPVTQKAWLPHTWTSTWWPVQPGWQMIHQQDSSLLYIYDKGDWTTVKAIASMTANTRYATVAENNKPSKEPVNEQETKQIPPIIFFVVFLICCSYLWFEAKKT